MSKSLFADALAKLDEMSQPTLRPTHEPQPPETDQQIIARQRRLIDKLQRELDETDLELCQLREESARQVNDLLDEVRKLREGCRCGTLLSSPMLLTMSNRTSFARRAVQRFVLPLARWMMRSRFSDYSAGACCGGGGCRQTSDIERI